MQEKVSALKLKYDGSIVFVTLDISDMYKESNN
jgi:hypothetical protein